MHANYKLILDKLNSFTELWSDLAELAYSKTFYRDTSSVDQQIEELKKFLVLKAVMKDVDETRLSPSLLVDEVWQMLASMTEAYTQLCQAILPDEEQIRMIHFNPAKIFPINKQKRFARYSDTILLYRALIGDPPTNIWPLCDSKAMDTPLDNTMVDLGKESVIPAAMQGEASSDNDAMVSDLIIVIQDRAQNLHVSFKVHKSLKLCRLFTEYCDKMCFLRGSVTFVLNGKRLSGEEKVSEMIFKDSKATISASCK